MNYSLRFVATGLLVMAANSCTIIAAEERGQGSAVAGAAVTVEPTPASDWERVCVNAIVGFMSTAEIGV